MEAKLQRGVSKTSTTVLGIAGPAVIAANNPPVPLPGGKPAVTVPLNAVLDCSTMPAKVSADAYRLRVRTRSGSRMHTGTVDAGAAGTHWRDQIRLACAAWSARQHVTASALTATVNPTLPQADLRLTLTNSGPHSVSLSTAAGYDPTIHLTSASPIRIPAHGSTQAALSVVLDRCDSVVEPPGNNSPLSQTPTLTTAINLVGLDSTVPLTPALTDEVPEGGGLAATGIVLSSTAADALRTALSNACGGLFAPLTVVPPGGVRYDDATGVVTVPVVVHAPRGRVRSVSLSPAAGELPENGYRPLWKGFPHLVPDGQGQARVTLRYQRPCRGRARTSVGSFRVLWPRWRFRGRRSADVDISAVARSDDRSGGDSVAVWWGWWGRWAGAQCGYSVGDHSDRPADWADFALKLEFAAGHMAARLACSGDDPSVEPQ